jgi:hypothetical protein
MCESAFDAARRPLALGLVGCISLTAVPSDFATSPVPGSFAAAAGFGGRAAFQVTASLRRCCPVEESSEHKQERNRRTKAPRKCDEPCEEEEQREDNPPTYRDCLTRILSSGFLFGLRSSV